MTERWAGYSRFSTDLQNDKSNVAQAREYRSHVSQQPNAVVTHDFEDAGLSGSSMIRRRGIQALLRAARAGEFDVVVTESLDRLSRSQGDIAAIFERLQYARVRLVTLTEGLIDEWKVGVIGAKNAVYLKDLAHKTRRGQREAIAEGRSAGGLSFGYRLDRSNRVIKHGREEILRGVLEIFPEQALVVVRIFRLYAAGMSPKAIAKLLNGEGVKGPRGRIWRASTIQGNAQTGVGILNNVLYIGRLRAMLRQYGINPETGLRGKAIMNPASSLAVKDVPHLRIVDDELWEQVKLRQQATRRAQREGVHCAKKAKYLFSKLTKCGVCKGGFTTESRDELRCSNYREAGTSVCTNGRVIKRKEVERRVLAALQQRFLTKDHLDNFTRLYVAETNRLRAELRSKQAAAPRELEDVKRRSLEILDFKTKEGWLPEAWKNDLRRLDERQKELEAMIAAMPPEPAAPALHPKMADVFERKIRQLAAALEHEDAELRETARQTLRGFIDRIVIPPGDALLQVVGKLGDMLTAAGAPREAAAVGDESCGGGI
jgi:site-specific DNA recombinase